MAEEVGMLEVMVRDAVQLPLVNHLGKQNPFVVLRAGGERRQTATAYNGHRSPVWGELLRLPVARGVDVLQLELFHESMFGKSAPIASSAVDLQRAIDGEGRTVSQLVRVGEAGHVKLDLAFRPSPAASSSGSQQALNGRASALSSLPTAGSAWGTPTAAAAADAQQLGESPAARGSLQAGTSWRLGGTAASQQAGPLSQQLGLQEGGWQGSQEQQGRLDGSSLGSEGRRNSLGSARASGSPQRGIRSRVNARLHGLFPTREAGPRASGAGAEPAFTGSRSGESERETRRASSLEPLPRGWSGGEAGEPVHPAAARASAGQGMPLEPAEGGAVRAEQPDAWLSRWEQQQQQQPPQRPRRATDGSAVAQAEALPAVPLRRQTASGVGQHEAGVPSLPPHLSSHRAARPASAAAAAEPQAAAAEAPRPAQWLQVAASRRTSQAGSPEPRPAERSAAGAGQEDGGDLCVQGRSISLADRLGSLPLAGPSAPQDDSEPCAVAAQQARAGGAGAGHRRVGSMEDTAHGRWDAGEGGPPANGSPAREGQPPGSFRGLVSPFAQDSTPLQPESPQGSGSSAFGSANGSMLGSHARTASTGTRMPMRNMRGALEAGAEHSVRLPRSQAGEAAAGGAGLGAGDSPLEQLLRDSQQEWLIPDGDLEIVVDDQGRPVQLGKGSFGTVFKGVYSGSTDVAVKTIKCETPADMHAAIQEVSILKSQLHPNIVQFLGVSIGESSIQLVTELMAGNLYHALRHGRCTWHKGGRKIAQNVASALAFMHHKKVVHLDVKSPNILLASNYTAKVADLGLSTLMNKENFVATMKGLGTLHWSAPEIFTGEHQVMAAADVYSFGTVLWEICTGNSPQRGQLRDLAPSEAPAAVAQLVYRCLDRDPGRRPTMQEAYAALKTLQE